MQAPNRSTSASLNQTAPSKLPARTPTVEPQEKTPVDEGYSSLPQNEAANAIHGVQEITTGFDRIVDIDDEEAEYQDFETDYKPLGKQAWNNIDLKNIEEGSEESAASEYYELEGSSEELPDVRISKECLEGPVTSEEVPKSKWIDGVPILSRLFGDKRGKRDNKVSDSPKQKRKMFSKKRGSDVKSKTQSSANTLLGVSARSLKVDDEESLEEERTRISEEAPNFNTNAEARLASVNQRLFEQKYRESGKQIGTGGHSTVKLAERTSDGKTVVCKYMQHTSVWNWYECPETKRKIPLEIHLMQKLTRKGVPGIIGYIEHFEMSGKYVIVMQYMGTDWMDLYDYIETFGPVIEKHTKEIFSRVVHTIDIMHNLGYCHNDIKGM
jgi:hypothetical protein